MLTEEQQHAFNVLTTKKRYYFRAQGVIVLGAYKSKKPPLYTFQPLQEQGLYILLVNGKLLQ